METLILTIIGLSVEMFIMGLLWFFVFDRFHREHMKSLGHPDYQDKEEVDKKEIIVKKPHNEKKLPSDYRNVD